MTSRRSSGQHPGTCRFPEISAEEYQRALMEDIKKHGNPTENKEESFLIEEDQLTDWQWDNFYECE
jgi:hypothetical protein